MTTINKVKSRPPLDSWKPGDPLSARKLQQPVDAINDMRGLTTPPQQVRPTRSGSSSVAEPTGLTILNADSITIPAYGVCKISSISEDGVVSVIQPDAADISSALLVVNGDIEILPGETGTGYDLYDKTTLVQALSDDSLSQGDECGTQNGSFSLSSSQTGAVCVDSGSEAGTYLIRPFL